ncbi:hypothetical protein BpHYR1_047975 [Brachionus plicatilis]|uniref:Uncharacterized protein n=1 Tax=Brachionus plicatilis TaxID=10195 RepID=A0A3M7PZJ5_BRAPC|nr:hypothetical protein BpHYR1_047975 [Brachionus plicatilis]
MISIDPIKIFFILFKNANNTCKNLDMKKRRWMVEPLRLNILYSSATINCLREILVIFSKKKSRNTTIVSWKYLIWLFSIDFQAFLTDRYKTLHSLTNLTAYHTAFLTYFHDFAFIWMEQHTPFLGPVDKGV